MARTMTEIYLLDAETQRKMILKNQHTIMVALKILVSGSGAVGSGHAANELTYDIAKVQAYLGL